MKFALTLLAAGLSLAVAKNVVSPDKFVVDGSNKLHKRDGINRVQDKPTHNDEGEQLFHIQDGKQGIMGVPKPGSGGVRPEDVAVGDGPRRGQPLLRTELDVNRDLTIFAGYVREFHKVGNRFGDKSSFTIVMAPTDDAVARLSKKPWEFPTEIDSSWPEEKKEYVTRANMLTFLQSHMHYGSISEAEAFKESRSADFLTETSKNIHVEAQEDQSLVVTTEDGIVARVLTTTPVKNGVIWILDTSLVSP